MDPTNYHGWDRAIVRFLKSANLLQALHGFENDMLVMNPDFEREEVSRALQDLRTDLIHLAESSSVRVETLKRDRDLEYVRLANGATPVSQTQLTRSISAFLAQNKTRNNASNRNEFLRRRRRVENGPDAEMEEGTPSEELPTCARTDAIPVNRDVQMKYDIAKNDGGPLRRTIKTDMVDETPRSANNRAGQGRMLDSPDENPTLERHPGLAERFSNLETHLAVRYVPSPPASLLDRIRFIEDHIMRLERDYPPWAALHFNQPKRGWPPPPRTTPLIVPSHLTSTVAQQPSTTKTGTSTVDRPTETQVWSARGGASKPKVKAKSSSLHRAVMDKLEVKKALAGED